jgi:hypothetical protein
MDMQIKYTVSTGSDFAWFLHSPNVYRKPWSYARRLNFT